MRPEEVALRTAPYLPNRVQEMVERHTSYEAARAPPTEREVLLHSEEVEALLPPPPPPLTESPLPTFDSQQLARAADTATDIWQAELDAAALVATDSAKAAEQTPVVPAEVFLHELLTPSVAANPTALQVAQAPPMAPLPTDPTPSPGFMLALRGMWHDLHHYDQLPATSIREKMHIVFIRNGRGNILLTLLLILLVLGTLLYFLLK
jgi:hypothetical protein